LTRGGKNLFLDKRSDLFPKKEISSTNRKNEKK